MTAAPSPARASAEPAFARTTLEAEGLLPRIALAALAALQVALIVIHEPWRDELQALMLAKHSASLADLLANLHYEGHPALWYLILRALSPFGGTLQALKAAQIAVALSTIAIVWTRAPFGLWMRLLVLAGYLILFEWGTIARSYGLGAMLYFAFLALHRRPLAGYLMLGLVANTSVHFMLLAGVSALFLPVLDRRVSFSGLALFAALCAVAVVTAWPAPDVHSTATLAPGALTRLATALETLSGALMPLDPRSVPPAWEGLTAPASVLAGILAGVLGAFALAPRSRAAAGFFLLLYVGTLAFSMFIYPAHTRHTGIVFLFLVGLEWMLAERRQGPVSILSYAWIVLMAVCGLWIAAWALFIPFTAMRDVARAIEERGLAETQWAAYPSFIGVELSARLDRPYYDVQQQCLAWFQKWNPAAVIGLKPENLDARLVAAAQTSGGRIMLLTEERYETPDLHLIEDLKPGLFAEPLRIYEVTAPAGAAAPLRACE